MKTVVVYLLLILVLISISGVAGAGEDGTGKMYGGMGYFMIGAHQLNLDKFNERLVAANYAEISNNFLSMGGAGYGIFNSLIIGGEGSAILTGTETTGHTKMGLGGGYGMFDLGYILYWTKSFRLYPILGLGFGSMMINAENKSTMPSFDELLDDPNRNLEMTVESFIINLSVNVDILKIMEENQDGSGGIIFGLRLGYLFSPYSSDWKMLETDVPGGPELNFTGPYLRLCIGGGGGSSSK